MSASWVMNNSELTFIGPIDAGFYWRLTLTEEINPSPAANTLSTYYEVELISDPANMDPTNAHGGNNRPIIVISNQVVPSASEAHVGAGTIQV